MKSSTLLMSLILCLIVADVYGNDRQNEKRLKDLIAADARKEPDPRNSFVSGGKARFAGYIKGYDPKQDHSNVTGIIYTSNEFTREDAPYVIEPDSTGWFQVEFELNAPARPYMNIGKARLTPYFEPGLTTALVLDWEDWLANRNKSRDFELTKSFFTGATGRLNNELYELRKIKMENFNNREFENVEEVVSCLTPARDSAIRLLDKALKQKAFLPLTHQLAKNEMMMDYEVLIFSKINAMKYKKAQVVDGVYMIMASSDSIPRGRYDFIKAIPDEPVITASVSFSTFINRYEYCDIFSGSDAFSDIMDDGFIKSGLAETNPDLTGYIELQKEKFRNLGNAWSTDSIDHLLKASWDNIEKKYPNIPVTFKAYQKIKEWNTKASKLEQHGLQAGFFYQTALVRSLNGLLNNDKNDFGQSSARIYIDYIKSNVLTWPLLRDEAESIYASRFENQGYVLPEGKATDLFRKIIEPYTGKMVLIDFWAIWCGPCIHGIKELKPEREKYKDSPDFTMLYFCGDTPKDRYEQLVQEFGLYNSVLLNDSEWNHMRQLFKFNGIPRYVLIGKDGKVITNNFGYTRIFDNTGTSSTDFEKSIEKYFVTP